MMKEKLTGIGALVSAFLASICCIGPLFLVGLGLGSAAMVASIEKYRPFFLILTSLFLALAFYLTYRKREIRCEDGRCEWRSGSKRMKFLLWIITLAVLGLATFPTWSARLLREPRPTAFSSGPKRLFKVGGMSCSACAVSIENSLTAVPGVQSASVDFEAGQAKVVLKGDSVPERDLIKAIQKAGPYQAKFIKGEL